MSDATNPWACREFASVGPDCSPADNLDTEKSPVTVEVEDNEPGHPGIRASGHPGIWASGHLGIRSSSTATWLTAAPWGITFATLM